MGEEVDPALAGAPVASTVFSDAWIDGGVARLARDRLAALSGGQKLADRVSASALAGNSFASVRASEALVGKLDGLRGDGSSLGGPSVMNLAMQRFGHQQEAIGTAVAGLSGVSAVMEKVERQQDIMRGAVTGFAANVALTGSAVDAVRRLSEMYRSTLNTDRYRNLGVGLTGYQVSLASRAWVKQLTVADAVHVSRLAEALKPLAARHAEMTRAWSSFAAVSKQASQLSAAMATVQHVIEARPQLFAIPGLGDGLLAYAGAQSILGTLPDTESLLRGGTAPVSRRLNTYLGSLGDRPTERRSRVAGLGSLSVSSLMLAEALLAPDLDADDAEYLESEAVEQILDPWQEGHDGYRADLYAALAEINPSLPEFLKGAWADIHTDGPAALIKVATCLTETLDWFLRSLVPLDTLPGWLAGQGLNGRTYLENGRPTRAAKIAYILRTRSRRDVTVIRTLERTLTRRLNDLRSDIEAMKHGGTIARVGDTAVRLHAHSVENLLGQFLFDL